MQEEHEHVVQLQLLYGRVLFLKNDCLRDVPVVWFSETDHTARPCSMMK